MRIVHPWDVVAAVLLAAFMSTVSVVARITQPDVQPVTGLGVALLVVCGLAFAVRSSHPLLAYVVTEAAAVAYLAWRFAGWPVYLGAFAGLAAFVSGPEGPRRQIPFVVAGGVGVTAATGPPEAWQPVRLATIALVWVAVALLADRAAQTRRRLGEQEAARRVAGERLRVARELHDILSHSLASISLQAGVGLHLVDRQPEQAHAALSAIRQASIDALAQARAALSVVRDAAPGLADLDALVASVRASGLTVDLDLDLDGGPVPVPMGTTAFRVVQEALTNVMHHAGPGAHAHARLGRVGTWLEIDVIDDGPGASTSTVESGHGLRGMAERVGAIGGELNAGPAPGGGFAVRARLPLGSGA